MRSDSEIEMSRRAYHECGHAVAAILLGGEVGLLTIDPEEPWERTGEIEVIWPEGDWTDAELAVREIKVALAGPIVEMIYDNSQFAPEYLEEWRNDWELAVDRARHYLPASKSVVQHLAGYVNDLLSFFERDDVWAAVAALADQLEAFETLEPEQINETLSAWPIFQ